MYKKSLLHILRILGLLLLVGIAVTACAPATGTLTEVEEPTPVEQPTEEVVEPITVQYTVPGGSPPDLQMVEDAINEMIHERLDPNLNIKLDFVDWGEYLQTVNLRFSAGETCDIVFTPKWWGLFYANQAQGNLAPLDDYMGDFPLFEDDIALMMPGTTIDGQVWGIPANNDVVASSGFGIRIDLLEKYPLDFDTINKLEDLEPYLLNIIENEPEIEAAIYPYEGFRPGYYGYDHIYTGLEGGAFVNGLLGVRYDDEDMVVVNLLKSEAFRDYVARMTRWHELGIVSDYFDDNAYVNFRTKYILSLHYQQPHDWWNPDYPILGKPLAPAFVGNFRVGENTTSICATSEHPREAYQVYAFINSDVEAFNTLVYGIEGTHWNWVDKDQKLIELPDVETMMATYQGPPDWAVGNQFISYYRDPNMAANDIWNWEREINASAVPSVLLGFHVDTEPVLTEIAQVSAVIAEYAPNLTYGWAEDWEADLAKLIQLTDDAGMDVIVAEVQRQVDDFKASK